MFTGCKKEYSRIFFVNQFLPVFLRAKILHIVVNQNKEGRYKMQKYIQLEGFVKSNNEAVEAVVQYLAEKYKIEKEEVKKYVDGATVNPEETYDFLDKVYALTKITKTKKKQRLVYVHVAEYCIEKLAGRADIVAVSPKETT